MRNFIGFLALCALCLPRPALALELTWRPADHLQARLVTSADTTGSAANIAGVLQLQLETGWHAYWRTPGGAGQPPELDWKASVNLGPVTMGWPAPDRFTSGGVQSFGYIGTVSFPLSASVSQPGQGVTLTLNARIFVCRDICVPETVSVTLPVPAGASGGAPDQALVAQAQGAVPATGDTPGLKIIGTVVGPDALVVNAFSQHGFSGADLFVEPASLGLIQPPQITPDATDPRSATLRIPKSIAGQNLAKEAMGQTLTLTLTTGDGAVEKSVPF